MAFNNVGPLVWAEQGQPVTWWYTRDGGADFGESRIEIGVADTRLRRVSNRRIAARCGFGKAHSTTS